MFLDINFKGTKMESNIEVGREKCLTTIRNLVWILPNVKFIYKFTDLFIKHLSSAYCVEAQIYKDEQAVSSPQIAPSQAALDLLGN